MGLRTLGELAVAREELLVSSFGPNLGRDLRRRARFEAGGEVSEARRVVSESRERTFDRDLRDPDELREALANMSRALCNGLREKDRSGRTIGIKVRLDDFTTVTRARTLAEATNDPDVVGAIALALLREYSPTRPVRLLGVRVAGLHPPGATGTDVSEAAGQLALPV
jgi:DNA polymerase-4